MAKRNPKHLAYEVNTGAKDVSFLPYDFDQTLLAADKREDFKKFLADVGKEPTQAESDPMRTVRQKDEPAPVVTVSE